MAAPPDTKHILILVQNVVEVSRLLGIHSQVTTPGSVRKHDVQILHKSAIVLLVACWEAYVEDIASISLEFMIQHCTDHHAFPDAVLERVASKNVGLKAWNLAGNGWKKALHHNLSDVLSRTAGTLNTPKTAQVDELLKKTIGIDSLSSNWYWKGRTVKQTTKALDALVTLPGSIAHRVTASTAVQKSDVIEARDLISRLAVRSSNQISLFIDKQIGKSPWPLVT
jgi:hypothetical protein